MTASSYTTVTDQLAGVRALLKLPCWEGDGATFAGGVSACAGGDSPGAEGSDTWA